MTKRASGPATGVTPKQAGTEHGSDAPAPGHGKGGPSTPAQPAGSIEETKAAWDRIAPGYDHFVTASRGWALPVEVLQRAGLREGMRFLDVASGSGALSLPAGRIGARVLAVDISPEMIERLRARARDEGLPNVEGRVMDGHALDLDDGLFDLAASQFGVMLFPDLPRALREMVRVTRPGGQVMLVAYGPPPTVEFLGFFLEAIGRVVPDFSGPPMDPPPLPFQVADPDVLRSRMVEAGLVDVRVEPTAERLEFRTGDEVWDWVTNSNPLATGIIAPLTKDQRREVRETLEAMVRERAAGADRVELNCLVHVAIGTR